MRNFLFLGLLFGALLLTLPADAQVRLGVRAGVNASNVKFQRDLDFDPLPGYQAGLQADISLSPNFSIQPALLYVTKGFSSELEFRNQQGNLTGTYRGSFRTHYLEFPVLALYKVNVSKTYKMFGGLGPYVAAGIGGKTNFNFGASGSTQNIVFGPKNGRPEGAYNRMDYGLAAAVGIEIRNVSLAVNYSYGMTGIGPGSLIVGAGAFYNRTLSLMAGYWLGKAK